MKTLIAFVIVVLIFSTHVFAREFEARVAKTEAGAEVPLHDNADLTVGNWEFWSNANGILAYHYKPKGIFPKGTANILYMQGVLWGAWLKDAKTGEKIPDSPLRVGGTYYRSGLQPGWIQSDGTPVSSDDPQVKIYFIRKDWKQLSQAQLKREAAYYFDIDSNAVTEQMISELKNTLADNWKNWPVELGAPYNDVNKNGVYDPVFDAGGFPDPTQGDYPGMAGADQVIWFVTNDLNTTKTLQLSGVPPIGLEVQTTLWTYKGDFTPLSQTVFVKYRLINKSAYLLDSMFVAITGDPDVGDYGDDLVGCDTLRNLWFAYNGHPVDAEYFKFGLTPPAIGYLLLAGPVDSLAAPLPSGTPRFLHSFFAFCTGEAVGDPPMGNADFTYGWYNIMQGYLPINDPEHPIPWRIGSGPQKGQVTRFPFSGDPVNDPGGSYGDVDGAGSNLPAGSRHFAGTLGPFRLAPGQTEDIVVAVIGGMGSSNRNAIIELKEISDILNANRNNGLSRLTYTPSPPAVKATSLEDKLVLNWGWDTQRIRETEEFELGALRFEGYNVYQLPSPQANVSDPGAVKIATIDVQDGVTTVNTWRYVRELGRRMILPLFNGPDSGLQRHLVIWKDYLHNQPLYRGSTYYFALTAYAYNSEYPEAPGYESRPAVVSVTMQGTSPGERFEAELHDTLAVQSNKPSDVVCKVRVIDPAATTGHDYQIFFSKCEDSTSVLYGRWVWNLKDETTGQIILKDQRLHTFEKHFELQDEVTADGLALYVQRPEKLLKAVVEVANGSGPLPESQWDDTGAPFHGNNVWRSMSAHSDAVPFYLNIYSQGNWNRMTSDSLLSVPISDDFELRFTHRGGLFLWWDDAGNQWAQVPFEFWDVGYGTYRDTTDDVRCITGGYSGGQTAGVFDFLNADWWGGSRAVASDVIAVRKPLNENGSYDAFARDVQSGRFTMNWWANSQEVLAGLVICELDGSPALPETGTVIRFITTKGPSEALTFWFTAPGRIENDLELARKDVEKINVFPNPVYAGVQIGPNGLVREVKINHLPRLATIRIFDLGGRQIRKLTKNDPSQFLMWDLRNAKGKPVASGLYVIYIDMPELRKTKTLKLMIVQSEN
jgi:hypothetical protein